MGKLVDIVIDGRKVQAEEGRGLVETAREHGIYIPSLCYYEHIQPPLGTCRVCTCSIDGQATAACSQKVRAGMEVMVHTPELEDLRKALVEMLFAEGNHFCPGCEKSGDCDLQHMGYELGVTNSRFPHLFKEHAVDFNPKRLLIEHNRCILCRRCMEEIRTDDGKRVFSFESRANKTKVRVDYEQEAKLSEEQAIRAMHICPVGAILVRGKSLPRPFGDRRYDTQSVMPKSPVQQPKTPPRKIGQPKVIATTSLSGCFGCHMSLFDIDLELLDLVELVSFDKSPINDLKNFTRRCDLGLIEGGCCNAENVEVLRTFREKCDILVAVGECAIWGGVPAMRNTVPLEECLEEAYLDSITSEHGNRLVPYHDDLPKLLDQVYPCNEIVRIDYYIPGCPPNANHIWKVIRNALFGADYSVLYSEFKYD